MKEFHEYCAKNKKEYNKDFFDDQRLLLFLQGVGYKPEKCLTAMTNHLEFRGKYIPMTLTE